MLQVKAKIIFNKCLKAGYWHCALAAPQIAKQATPGQFVSIKITDKDEPLLRRPFSIHRRKASSIEILYEVLGPGTQILSQKKPREYLDIVGPLGHGFDFKEGHETTILVAGGMGVAPLIFLAEKLAGAKTLVFIGAKAKSQILCEKEFQKLGCSVKIATDDGSKGFKGKVTELLKDFLRNNAIGAINTITLYACGPRPMLKEISRISKKYNIPAEISLEEHLACGIGACLGCVVNTKNGYQRVCQEGPVFLADEIIW